MTRDRALASIATVTLLGSVVLANWLVQRFGMIPVGLGLLPDLGLTAAAGTLAAGVALIARDIVHDTGGVTLVLITIAAGAGLSAALGDGRIALASALAFGLSEVLDLAVYTPLRQRDWTLAVAGSNFVGGFADTVLFLAVSGLGATPGAVAGQMVMKLVWVTGTFLLLAWLVRRLQRRVVLA